MVILNEIHIKVIYQKVQKLLKFNNKEVMRFVLDSANRPFNN